MKERLYQMIVDSVFTDKTQSPVLPPTMLCAFGPRLDVGLAERSTPCRFVGTLNVFVSTF